LDTHEEREHVGPLRELAGLSGIAKCGSSIRSSDGNEFSHD
jgi:hypothetical protein